MFTKDPAKLNPVAKTYVEMRKAIAEEEKKKAAEVEKKPLTEAEEQPSMRGGKSIVPRNVAERFKKERKEKKQFAAAKREIDRLKKKGK